MSTPMWGYVRLELLADTRIGAIAVALEGFASRYGGTVRGRVYYEPGQSAQALWRVVRAADEESGGRILPVVHAAAGRNNVSVQRMLAAPPSTAALWRVLDVLAAECANGERGYLIVPTPAHFDGLGVPRELVLQRIADTAPCVTVLYIYPSAPHGSAGTPLSELHPDGDHRGVLADFQVHAYADDAVEVVRANVEWRLERAGLSEMVEATRDLLYELVEEAAEDESADRNTLRVRLLCASGASRLTVQLWETLDHDVPVSDVVIGLVDPDRGGVVERVRSRVTDATVTRCELPLPGSGRSDLDGTADPANSVRRYVQQSRSAS